MTIADYDKVYSLWTGTAGMGLRSLDDSPAGIEKFLRRNPSTCFVAEEEGILAGVILCGHDGRRGYIYHAAVAPQFRRRGVGKLLVDAALTALKEEGILKAALVAFETNALGNAFWESMGFEKREDLVYRNKSLSDANH
jgi:ribosomal protein S18 acetylase RimI-like enzyme